MDRVPSRTPQRLPVALLAVVVACCAAYVLHTGDLLPATVASHFNGSGVADGHMGRGIYLAFFAALTVAVPLMIGLLPAALAARDAKGLNIPHREHWLAPERRVATVAFLSRHGAALGAVLAIFLSLVHAQVVAANQRQPATLDMAAVWPALGAFIVAVVVWVVVLQARFRKLG